MSGVHISPAVASGRRAHALLNCPNPNLGGRVPKGRLSFLSARCLVIASLAIALASAASAAPVLSFAPASTSVTVGDVLSMELVITDVADLFAYQFDISFDPAVLRA